MERENLDRNLLYFLTLLGVNCGASGTDKEMSELKSVMRSEGLAGAPTETNYKADKRWVENNEER